MTVALYLNISINPLLPQCSLGTVTLEVGRIKAGPFHSERRPSQSSQVGSSEIHLGHADHTFKRNSEVALPVGWFRVMDAGLALSSWAQWGTEFGKGKSKS